MDPKFLIPGAPANKNSRTITVKSLLADDTFGSTYYSTASEADAVGFAERAAGRGSFGPVQAYAVVEDDTVLHSFPIVKKEG